MTNTVLILGAAGFVGSNLIRSILYNDKNCNIVGLDKLVHSSNMNNVYINKSHQFYIADATDVHILSRICEVHRPNVIIDLTNDDDYKNNPERKLEVSKNVIECCKKWCIDKYIYISTIYETIPSYYLSADNIIANLRPVSLVSEYQNSCILRVPDLFGPRQSSGTILNYIKSGITEKTVYLNSKSGAIVKDYLHVEDLVSSIISMISNDMYGIYNVTENIDYSELEICGFISQAIDGCIISSKCEIDGVMLNIYNPINANDVKDYKWKPNRKFRDKLKFTVDWYKSNQWILKNR